MSKRSRLGRGPMKRQQARLDKEASQKADEHDKRSRFSYLRPNFLKTRFDFSHIPLKKHDFFDFFFK